MRPFLLLLPSLALAGCAIQDTRPFSAVDDVQYSALGQQPFWTLAIGDDRIVLSRSFAEQPGQRSSLVSYSFPRTLPRTMDGTRRWESSDGRDTIIVEARQGPCAGAGGRRFEDVVTVRLGGWIFTGCGGRMLRTRRA